MADRPDTRVKRRPIYVYFTSEGDADKGKPDKAGYDHVFRPTMIVVQGRTLAQGIESAVEEMKKLHGADYKHAEVIAEYDLDDGELV